VPAGFAHGGSIEEEEEEEDGIHSYITEHLYLGSCMRMVRVDQKQSRHQLILANKKK
jgi:hypothetical protein